MNPGLYVVAPTGDLTTRDLQRGFPDRFAALPGPITPGWCAFQICKPERGDDKKLLTIFGDRVFLVPPVEGTFFTIKDQRGQVRHHPLHDTAWANDKAGRPDVLYTHTDIDGRHHQLLGREYAAMVQEPTYWQIGGQEWRP